MRHRQPIKKLLGLWMAVLCACSSEDPAPGAQTGSGGIQPADDTEAPPPNPTLLDVGGGDAPLDDDCEGIVEQANQQARPADVIFMVDNSSSMAFEVDAVQANLNAFSEQVGETGVDIRVILLSTYPDGSGYGLCIDAPLGSGGCPDEDNNPPRFVHIDTKVGSNDGLEVLLDEQQNWLPYLREEASLHLVMVSDDDATKLTAQEFHPLFVGIEPRTADYRFHGVVGLQDCSATENIGDGYVYLAELTEGTLSDLCDQDFQPVFDALAQAVVSGSTLSCQWSLPVGGPIDPELVNFEFEDDTGARHTIGRVADMAQCDTVEHGWYYDNPVSPAAILACPQTCSMLQSLTNGSVEIRLGCKTVPAE